jgi:hypothetical protein
MKKIVIIVCLVMSANTTLAADKTKCNIDKFAAYSKARETWQKDVTDLAIQAAPEAENTANVYMNNQLMLIKSRALAVKLLLENSPEKVSVKERLRRWIILRPNDKKALEKLSPEYATLQKNIAKARLRKAMPDGDKLRDAMRTKVAPSPQFREIFKAFNDKINEINRIRCE